MTEPAQAIRLEIPRPAHEVVKGFQALATTAISDIIDLGCVMRYAIRPLWPDMPRIAGPAFTVRTAHHDNLMLNHPIRCGGVVVHPGDMVVADDEGIVVVPLARAPEVLRKAQAKAEADAKLTLEAWEKNHRAKVDATLKAKGYLG